MSLRTLRIPTLSFTFLQDAHGHLVRTSLEADRHDWSYPSDTGLGQKLPEVPVVLNDGLSPRDEQLVIRTRAQWIRRRNRVKVHRGF